MTAWPGSLPKPKADGFGLQPNPQGVRFEVDSGPAAQRRTTTARTSKMDMVFRCTNTQRQTLDDFFQGRGAYAGGGGAAGGAWFDFTHPLTGDTIQARFLIGTEPKVSAVPPRFDVSVSLEVYD